MGTTVTPEVDPDHIRSLDSAWQTFFDTAPDLGASPSAERLPGTEKYRRPVDREPTKAEEEELDEMRRHRASIEDRRSRLLQLHQLDDELEMLNFRIQNAERRSRSKG
jgi:hypothetical protein